MLGGEVGAHVEGCEGRLVIVAEVVEEDAVGACRCDCYDCRGRVVGAQVGGGKVETRLGRRRTQGPEANRIVKRAGDESVSGRAEGK